MTSREPMSLLVVSINLEHRGHVPEIEDVVMAYTTDGRVILDRWGGEQGVCAFRVKDAYLQEVKEKFSPEHYRVEQRALPSAA